MSKNIYRYKDLESLVDEHKSLEAVAGIIGEKGTKLAQLHSIKVNVPNGFIISSNAYKAYAETETKEIPSEIWNEIVDEIKKLEEETGLSFGGAENPLFLACRGDSQFAMPGMLDFVVNIGLNDLTARKMSTNRAFVWDSYRRLVQGFGSVVLKIPAAAFDEILRQYQQSRKKTSTTDLSDLDWIEVTKLYKSLIMRRAGKPFPQEPFEQLKRVITAIYTSYTAGPANKYREINKISSSVGESILVMPMAFGNNGKQSFSSVVHSRNPITGDSQIDGEFCFNATCDDIANEVCDIKILEELKNTDEDKFSKIKDIAAEIEKFFKKPQTIDIVCDNGKIFVLQTRECQFASIAKFKAFKDMAESSIITKNDALSSIEPDDLKQLMMPVLKEGAPGPLCTGKNAGNGAIVGRMVLSNEKCIAKAKLGDPIVLVKPRLFPSDYEAVCAARAVVTVKGQLSSFTSTICRRLKKIAVIGCDDIKIDGDKRIVTIAGTNLKEGAELTITGAGHLIQGRQEIINPLSFDSPDASTMLSWADDARKGKINVYTIASNPEQVGSASSLGADGVGMFPLEDLFDGKGAILIRAMLDNRRETAVTKFEGLVTKVIGEALKASNGIPVTARLFNPPFNQFLPDVYDLVDKIGALKAKKEMTDEEEFNEDKDLDKKVELLETIKSQQESNPKMGFSGIRLALVQSDFLNAQIKGILNGAKAAREGGASPDLRILLPKVTEANEIARFKKVYEEISNEIGEKAKIGCEITNPRACLTSKYIAAQSDFIIFNTSELTEITFGMCQKDAEHYFLPLYIDGGYLAQSPFKTIDIDGVGQVMKIGVKGAKSNKEDIPVGVHGEACGDPTSIAYFSEIGIDSITCEPSVVPIARLSAAKAVISQNS